MTVRKPVVDELQGYLSKEGELRRRFLRGLLDPKSVLDYLQSAIEETQNTVVSPLAQQELDALRVYRRKKEIIIPTKAQITATEWQMWRFAMPGGLTRQPALSACKDAGVSIWHNNPSEADYTGETLPTGRGIIEVPDLDKFFRNRDKRFWGNNAPTSLINCRETGYDGYCSAEQVIEVLRRYQLLNGRLPADAGWIRCSNTHSVSSSLNVRWDPGFPLFVSYYDLGDSDPDLCVLPGSFREFGV